MTGAASGTAPQAALAFPPGAADGAGDFLVAAANREAAEWVARWPDWPAPGLAVHGPPGCGKSHLLAVWARRAGARRVAAHDLGGALADLAAEARAVALDDLDAALAAGVDETALFALHDSLVARGGALLASAAAPPRRWRAGLADLRSRLRALPAAAIAAPDDDLLAAVLVKQFADRGAIVAPATIDYLVGRIERSFAAARRIAARADRAAWERKRAIGIPLVRELLRADDEARNSGGG